MNILILMTSYKSMLSVREELVDGLLAAGHAVSIAGPFDGNENAFIQKGCSCINLAVQRRGTSVRSDLKSLLSYRRVIRDTRPDLVMTFSIKANIYGGLAARLSGVPRLVSLTGLGSGLQNGGLLSKLLIFLYRVALRGAQCVFFQNGDNLRFMTEARVIFPGQRTRMISGSGVNLKRFAPADYPADSGECRLLFIGRLMKEKGLDELLAAFEAVRKEHPCVSLDILGADEEGYQKRLAGFPPQSNVCYHGEAADVRPYIQRCHCVVLPSYHEGMANALLEAAASGRPVIASRVPGCVETFEEGVSGLGCEPRDADSLARAMEEFIRLPHGQKRRMGLDGCDKMMREFDRGKVVKAYLEEIESVWKAKAAS